MQWLSGANFIKRFRPTSVRAFTFFEANYGGGVVEGVTGQQGICFPLAQALVELRPQAENFVSRNWGCVVGNMSKGESEPGRGDLI